MWNNDRIIPLDAQQVYVDYWQSAYDRRGHRSLNSAHTVAAVSGREEDGGGCQVLRGKIFAAADRSHESSQNCMYSVGAVSGREEGGAVCQGLCGVIFAAVDRSHEGVWERIMER